MQPTTTPVQELWAPTGDAARLLGVSAPTLKRWANPTSHSHCLQEGLHFRRGRLQNSPLRWRVDLIEQVITERTSPTRPTSQPVVITEEAAA